jgi:ABC-2 type transport system permease protein
MLRNVLSIALLHIRLVLSNRSVFFFSVLMPIIFTAFMAQANVTSFGSSAVANWQIDVATFDRGPLGQRLVADLRADNRWTVKEVTREEALGRVKSGASAAALIIPEEFSESVFGGRRAALDLRTCATAPAQAQLAEQFVREAADKVIAAPLSAEVSARLAERVAHPGQPATDEQRRVMLEEGLAQAANAFERAPPVAVKFESDAPLTAKAAGRNSGANQSSPGVVVIFALLFATSGTNVLIWERRAGTLRRLLVTPASKATILFGKLLGIYLISLAQITLLILAGAFLFGVAWGSSPLALVLMVLAFTLVATSMGVLLATLVQTIAQADALASMVVMSVSALGGAWWPLSETPHWMRVFGHLFPTAWAMDGFQNIVVGQQSAMSILPEFAVLLGFAALFLSVGLLRFRYQ